MTFHRSVVWPMITTLLCLASVACGESEIERLQRIGREQALQDSIRLANRTPAQRLADSLKAVAEGKGIEQANTERIAEMRRSGSARCSHEDGRVRLSAMHEGANVSVSEEDGWVVVRIRGHVLPDNIRRWVELYADGDACATGRARKLEFRDAGDALIARADPFNGIRMQD